MFGKSLRQFFELAVMYGPHPFLSLPRIGLDKRFDRTLDSSTSSGDDMQLVSFLSHQLVSVKNSGDILYRFGNAHSDLVNFFFMISTRHNSLRLLTLYNVVHMQSGGSFGDAFDRPHELQGEVSPKRGAAIDAQLEAEDQALLEQKRARKAGFGPTEG